MIYMEKTAGFTLIEHLIAISVASTLILLGIKYALAQTTILVKPPIQPSPAFLRPLSAGLQKFKQQQAFNDPATRLHTH